MEEPAVPWGVAVNLEEENIYYPVALKFIDLKFVSRHEAREEEEK